MKISISVIGTAQEGGVFFFFPPLSKVTEENCIFTTITVYLPYIYYYFYYSYL